jgi:hypothetical protein
VYVHCKKVVVNVPKFIFPLTLWVSNWYQNFYLTTNLIGASNELRKGALKLMVNWHGFHVFGHGRGNSQKKAKQEDQGQPSHIFFYNLWSEGDFMGLIFETDITFYLHINTNP